MRFLRSLLPALALLVLGSTSAPAGQVRVDVANNLFTPRAINCNAGDHVVWVWLGSNHTVTSGDSATGAASGIFSTSILNAPTQFAWKSSTNGVVPYYCAPHRLFGMSGRVIVGSGIAVSDFRITEVQYNAVGGIDRIEISNVGDGVGNLGRYRVAVNGATAAQIPLDDLDVAAAGSPGSIVVIHANEAGANTPSDIYLPALGDLGASGSVALYVPNTVGTGAALTTASMMIDFVQWGASSQPNEATAGAAGVWTTGEFIPTVGDGHSIELCNTINRNASSWSEVATPNLGADGDCLTPANTTMWGRVKSLYR